MTRKISSALEAGRLLLEESQLLRWSALEADISHFVTGGRVTADLMKPLTPRKYERWALRSVRPKPSLRVLGRFAEPDVFVATHVEERKSLGGRGNMAWELAMVTCEALWHDVFGDLTPFSGKEYKDYITQNASEFLDITP